MKNNLNEFPINKLSHQTKNFYLKEKVTNDSPQMTQIHFLVNISYLIKHNELF